jgi:DNA replication protein DnaC
MSKGRGAGRCWPARRGLDKALFAQLATGDWIGRRHDLLITGKTGTGKSWLACALGHKACRDDRSVLYYRVPRLLDALAWRAATDGMYASSRASPNIEVEPSPI